MTRVPLATRRSGIVLLGLVAATVCCWQRVRPGANRRAVGQERTRVERHPEETCSGDGWCVQKLVQGDRKALLALWAASANDVWAVGDTVAHWDGVRWSERKGILGHDLATDERRLSVIHGTATTAFSAFGRRWSLFWDGTQPPAIGVVRARLPGSDAAGPSSQSRDDDGWIASVETDPGVGVPGPPARRSGKARSSPWRRRGNGAVSCAPRGRSPGPGLPHRRRGRPAWQPSGPP
jgi:hypothetical protein